MGLLTISVSNKLGTSLTQLIKGQLDAVNEWRDGLYTLIHIDITNKNSKIRLTNALTEFIFRKLAPIWIKKILSINYGYFDLDEQNDILVYAYRDLWSCPSQYYHSICHALANHLSNNDEINLEGFIRFRTRDFWQFLEDTLDSAVDAYLMDQEYKEFVKLLSYFVELQEPKVELVNVVLNKDDSFKILDYKGVKIETNFLESIILEIGENGLDFEDLLISALITIAPAKLVLHVGHNSRTAQTVINIFGDRVFICDYCLLCKDIEHRRKGK